MAILSDFENKVMDYLIKRKTAATVKQIAKFFIRSESYVSGTMRLLEQKELIQVVTAGKTKFFAVKD
jgi:Mn-dependent DtxR family transcriptional regulator